MTIEDTLLDFLRKQTKDLTIAEIKDLAPVPHERTRIDAALRLLDVHGLIEKTRHTKPGIRPYVTVRITEKGRAHTGPARRLSSPSAGEFARSRTRRAV